MRLGVIVGVLAAVLQLFPTGDVQGRMVAENQPATLAAMEGLFETQEGAPWRFWASRTWRSGRLDNPLVVPHMLSFLTYRHWSAHVQGLDAFPADQWPDKIALLYYSYHVMVGLGTIFIAVMVLAAFLLLARNKLFDVALDAVDPDAERAAAVHRQHRGVDDGGARPAAVADLWIDAHDRTVSSPRVSAGNAWFTLMGFMGMYTVLAILWLFLVYREIEHGPEPANLATGRNRAVAAD